MCGICGILSKNKDHQADGKIEAMMKTMKHRGPDDSGVYFDKKNNLGFGFNRLAIIDLSLKGHQPMTNEDKSIWVIFNGEIYNYEEIKTSLIDKHKFRSKTDTEVIVHGYEEWGERIFEKLQGMFGLAIWDEKKQKLLLARDRIGEKPLFYYYDNNQFIFASEFRSILKVLPKAQLEINQKSLELWSGFPYLPDNCETLVKNIHKIPPGFYLTLKNKDITLKQYWRLKINEKIRQLDFSKACSQLENLLNDSVKKRLVADVPVGILLSGGLDSSVITALAKKNKNSITTLTATFKDVIDESYYAKIVGDHLKTRQLFLNVEPKNVIKNIEKIIWIFDDLSTADGGLITTYYLAKEIKERGIKVVLVGEGADELFGGYSWFGLGAKPFTALPEFLRTYMYYWVIMRSLNPKFYLKYPDILKSHLNESPSKSYFGKVNYNEIKYSLPNHYCMKIDKGTSAASIEARAPYLDYRVVEFVYNLQDNYKLKGGYFSKDVNEKFILRKIGEKYLPESIFNRKKKGGMLPIDKLLDQGKEKITDYLLDKDGIAQKLFSRNSLENILKPQTFTPLKWQREWIIWRMFLLSVWYKKTYKGLS